MKKGLLPIILSQSLIALGPGHAEVRSLASPVPVPQTMLVPVTRDSYPLGAADHLNVPEDLSQVGYLEEEYLVSGTANVYNRAPPGAATVEVAKRALHHTNAGKASHTKGKTQRQCHRGNIERHQSGRLGNRVGLVEGLHRSQRRRVDWVYQQASDCCRFAEVQSRALCVA